MTHEPDASATRQDVLAVLEPDQLVVSKRLPLPRRALKPGELLTLWVLRLYLLTVVGILIYQVVAGGR